MDKIDFLQECMSEFKGAPIDAFNKEFCVLCSNRQCARSWGNNSTFDARVKNWRTLLFENVPRSEDPNMANPKFEIVEPGRIPEVNTQTFEPVDPGPGPLSYEDVPDTDPAPPPLPTRPPAKEPEPAKPNVSDVVNTPFDKPIMLGGMSPVLETKPEEKTEQGCVFVFDDE